MAWYRGKSSVAQQMYKRVKFGQIVVGGMVPVLAVVPGWNWLTAIVAATVVIAEGAQQLFQWQNNWLGYRSIAEALKGEKYLYLAHAGNYRDGDRRTVLAERLEQLLSQQNLRWIDEHESQRSVPPPTTP
ncbi:DUF4231 domain-containing protein [Nocardia uniformis]|uniref:DUF4231 domain-containing protein n=1 Tax=Nocardia uniformis TaxID=53432 RepID=A0A849CCK7_9NOCA|nr:DUF4231 domain-containing protein [Nocardia uniformis]